MLQEPRARERRRRTRLPWAALFFGALAVACEHDDRCDRGQNYNGSYCLTVPPTAAPDAAEADDAAAASEGDALDPFEGIGKECETTATCTGVANWCAIDPLVGPPGLCSRTGCLATPSICPPRWTCLDLSLFASGLPAICQPPG